MATQLKSRPLAPFLFQKRIPLYLKALKFLTLSFIGGFPPPQEHRPLLNNMSMAPSQTHRLPWCPDSPRPRKQASSTRLRGSQSPNDLKADSWPSTARASSSSF